MHILRAILLVVFVLFVGHAYAADMPIQLLTTLVNLADKDEDQLDNLLNGRGDTKFKQTVDYSRYLTPALINSIRSEETRLLNQDCQGHYQDGEICGIDHSPLTCAQDTLTFTYKIKHSEATKAVITAQYLNYPEITTYYFVRIHNHWKIDGIDCGTGAGFNVKN